MISMWAALSLKFTFHFYLMLCFSLLFPWGRFRLVQKTGQACTALAFSLRRTTEFLVALADYTIKCFDKGRTDTAPLLCSFYSHLVFFRFSAPLTILSSSFFQTQSRWWVGCGVTREQSRPSLSTAQVATQSALPWTRLSSGTWTRSRGKESSTLDSLLAFRG